MLILGIILTILGLWLLKWITKSMNEPFYNRPLLFHKTIPVLILQILWIGLLGGGLYSFWKVNHKIVLFLIGGFVILWIFGYFIGSHKNKAKKFFKIYKQLKTYRPQTEEKELWRESAKLYFKNIGWDKEKIESILNTLLGDRDLNIKDVKDFVRWIFVFENPDDDFSSVTDFEARMKKTEKRESAIEKAYEKVFGQKSEVKERPILSEDALKRIRATGLNPDEMTNAQLSALEEMENANKSHWSVSMFYFAGSAFGLSAIIALFKLHFDSLIFSIILAVIFIFIGSKIQTKSASKKFYEASILKWSDEQQKKETQ